MSKSTVPLKGMPEVTNESVDTSQFDQKKYSTQIGAQRQLSGKQAFFPPIRKQRSTVNEKKEGPRRQQHKRTFTENQSGLSPKEFRAPDHQVEVKDYFENKISLRRSIEQKLHYDSKSYYNSSQLVP